MSASDVERLPSGCGLHGSLKVRHKLEAENWEYRKDKIQPFILGIIRDICLRLHEDCDITSWEKLDQQVQVELSQHQLHPALHRYARRAIENYLNCHELIERDLGKLRVRVCDPQVCPDSNFSKNQLTVWAPVYDSDTGVREIRRLRFGDTRPASTKPDVWAITAAHVAGLVRPRGDLRRIRVVEIGLGRGTMRTLFDDSPEEAKALYEAHAIPAIVKINTAGKATPGNSCGKCKVAGCCTSLEKLDGFLGQSRRGHATRSVSARDIEVYEKCPAQWYLSSSNLPGAAEVSNSSGRGKNVHDWLASAHMGNRTCDPSDLDTIDEHFPSALSEEEYLEAREFVTLHASMCALGDGVRVIGSEISIYGYDSRADAVIVSKPDLLYVDADDTFVIRETKTTTLSLPENEKEAFDRFFAVPWLLNLIATGYRGPYKSERARLELEVLTPTGGRVFEWDLNDSGLLRMANAEVRTRAKRWHRDTTWSSTPGEHCKWCEVREWCPDARAVEEDTDEVQRLP
ncbi:PD-(D/E)XK nuclease family protein [Streptomyces sp. NPDC014892]|uniref:PD-(D/E)XK nuclease family protein n=1 Tax=Streptomyces sp. NPDC014892 TaxID=3364930 RepID=UPI0036FAA4B8